MTENNNENDITPKKSESKKTSQKAAKTAPKKPSAKKTTAKKTAPQENETVSSDKSLPPEKETKSGVHKTDKIKESLSESLSELKNKFDDLSSKDKIFDEYDKAKSEAKKTNWLSDIKTAFRFFTRLPLPASETETPMNGRALWAAPLVGVVIGLIGGLIFVAAAFIGLPEFLCAALAITSMIIATGCFHEDAIADVADGFGGGWTKEQKLEIMKDSRIGTYGATALFLTLLLKIGALASIAAFADTPISIILLLIACGSASRAAGVALLTILPPLRDMSSGREPGNPNSFTLILALIIGGLVSVIGLSLGFGFSPMLAGLAGAVIGGGFVGWLANRQIGGQTGDVAGTCQQGAELGMLFGALIALSV